LFYKETKDVFKSSHPAELLLKQDDCVLS